MARVDLVRRAAEAGVGVLMSIGVGSGPPVLDAGLKMTELAPPQAGIPWPVIYTSVGVHPHEAKQAGEADFVELERYRMYFDSKHRRVLW